MSMTGAPAMFIRRCSWRRLYYHLEGQGAGSNQCYIFCVRRGDPWSNVRHSCGLWMSTNAGKFNNIWNKTKCINDINWHFKIAAHVNLVPVLLRLMLQKWVQEYGEPLVARDWLASWGKDILTRVQNFQVHLCPLQGWIPCDNNALEAVNASDKKSVSYKKVSLFTFVDTCIVDPNSMDDTMFQDTLKARSFTKMNTAVHNMKYFAHIASIKTLDFKGIPTYLHLQWDYTDERKDETQPGVTRISYVLCTSFSFWICCTIATRKGIFLLDLFNNLYHDLITKRLIRGIIKCFNQTPIDWYSKKKPKVKMATCGSDSWC